jgi:hypothetical protein
MYWHRSIAHRRIAFRTRGNWLSFLARIRPPVRPERTERLCESCGGDTPHDSYDDTGYGWYAQMWRCRYCGRENMKVWPIAF